MGMAHVRVGHAGLRSAIGFRAGVDAAHPADLMGADAFRGSCYALRAEVRALSKHTGNHGGDVLRRISRPDMGRLIGETRPFMMVFPSKVVLFEVWLMSRRRPLKWQRKDTRQKIVTKLRPVDVLNAQGKSMAEAIRSIGVREVAYSRWRAEYGGVRG
jgi:hypothetical protein